MKKLLVLLFVLLLSACGSKKIDGTYFNSSLDRGFTFTKSGIVFENNASGKNLSGDLSYLIDGDQIKIENSPYTFKLNSDGTINGGMAFGTMTKK